MLSMELLEACLRFRVLCEEDSANSSPEASREDGCWRSLAPAILFRFAEDADDGEDIFGKMRGYNSRKCTDEFGEGTRNKK